MQTRGFRRHGASSGRDRSCGRSRSACSRRGDFVILETDPARGIGLERPLDGRIQAPAHAGRSRSDRLRSALGVLLLPEGLVTSDHAGPGKSIDGPDSSGGAKGAAIGFVTHEPADRGA